MATTLDPSDRLGYDGNLQSTIEHAIVYFTGGKPTSLKHLAEGYEDCNIRVQTNSGTYVVKLFANNQLGDYSKTRRGDDVAGRLVDIINTVRANGANAPELVKAPAYGYKTSRTTTRMKQNTGFSLDASR